MKRKPKMYRKKHMRKFKTCPNCNEFCWYVDVAPEVCGNCGEML